MEADDKKLNDFTKNIINEAGLQQPSADFMNHVMAEVSKEKVPVSVHKPLINKAGWIIIGSMFAFFTFVLTQFSLGFSFFADWNLSSLLVDRYHLTFSVANTYTYCAVFLFIFVLMQVYFFSNRVSKKLQN